LLVIRFAFRAQWRLKPFGARALHWLWVLAATCALLVLAIAAVVHHV
jgi:hypothetical protein